VPVEYRRLGRDGPEVSVVGLGFWSIAGAFGTRDDAEAERSVARAIELGATFFDTAPSYGDAEAFLGRVLGPARRGQVFLTTKCGIGRDPTTGRSRPDGRPETIRQGVRGSLARLGCEQVDLLLVHWPDRDVPVAETVGAVEQLRREGLTRYVGVSNFTAEQLRQAAAAAPILCNEVGYHLFDRRWESAMFPTAAELGVSIVAYSPMANGLLSGRVDPASFGPPERDVRARGGANSTQRLWDRENLPHNLGLAARMAEIAARDGVSLPQAAIAWVLSNPLVTCALSGSRQVARLEENLGALDVRLSRETIDALAALGRQAAGQVEGTPTWRY
jgi:aryl-alcohol dehydrogenase-like predicted oxidoreductase